MHMDYQKALFLLGLKEGYTSAELKSQYRNLAKKYHPDNYENASCEVKKQMQERMQEINEAKNFLDKYNKNNRNYQQTTTKFDSLKYKQELIEKLVSYGKISDCSDVIVMRVYDNIVQISFDFGFSLLYHFSKDAIDEEYKKSYLKIMNEFKKFQDDYYQKNGILKEQVKESIHYDCSLDDFYNQLMKINEKYGFKKKLKDATLEYQLYPGYDRIKILIDLCVDNAFLSAKKNNFQNREDIINDMHQEIRGCFDTYFGLKSKLETLKKEIEGIEDVKIKEKLQQVSKDFLQGKAFADIENGINEVEVLIKDYNEKLVIKNKVAQEMPTINILYKKIISKYQEVLLSLNVVSDYEKINYAHTTLKNVLNLFKQWSEGLIPLDSLMLLEQLTFENQLEDAKLIHIVDNNTTSVCTSNIYLKLFDEIIDCNLSFFLLQEENNELEMLNFFYGMIIKRKITLEELKDYISLDEVLSNATFVNKQAIYLMIEPVIILYRSYIDNHEIVLYLMDDIIKVAINNTESFIEFSENKDVSLTMKYSNKEYVKNAITKQLQECLRKEKEENSVEINAFEDDFGSARK